MKKLLIISVSLMCAVSSCDFLETKVESNITTQNFFRTTEDFDMALTGIYYTFTSVEWDNQHRYGNYFTGFMYWGRIGTDECYVPSANNGENMIGYYTYTPEHLFVEKVWFMQYLGIQRANVVLNRLAQYTGDAISEQDRNRIAGEAYFLRGWFYFQLARYFGEVPLVLTETTDLDELDTRKASLAEVYDRVIKDYEEAERLLPETNTVGHAYKMAATALKARAYLQMSGEPLRDPSAASLAAAACRTVIQSGRFRLVEDYFSQFDGLHEHNSEYIFDVEFDNSHSNSLYGGQVGTTDGMPHPDEIYWTQVRAFPEMYRKFEENDLRRGAVDYGGHVEQNPQTGKMEIIYGDENYKNDYWVYKFRHPLERADRGSSWANWCNNINFPIIRYADVLLMLAEAEWRVDGSPSSEAIEYVNKVRRRGYGVPMNTEDPDVDYSLSDEPFEDFILEERSRELCFEGHRWADLVRFGKLQEAYRSVGLDPDWLLTPYYDVLRPNCQEKHSIFPIPQSVIDASHGAIKQNPLWE